MGFPGLPYGETHTGVSIGLLHRVRSLKLATEKTHLCYFKILDIFVKFVIFVDILGQQQKLFIKMLLEFEGFYVKTFDNAQNHVMECFVMAILKLGFVTPYTKFKLCENYAVHILYPCTTHLAANTIICILFTEVPSCIMSPYRLQAFRFYPVIISAWVNFCCKGLF